MIVYSNQENSIRKVISNSQWHSLQNKIKEMLVFNSECVFQLEQSNNVNIYKSRPKVHQPSTYWSACRWTLDRKINWGLIRLILILYRSRRMCFCSWSYILYLYFIVIWMYIMIININKIMMTFLQSVLFYNQYTCTSFMFWITCI